jgi:hypothetical protein
MQEMMQQNVFTINPSNADGRNKHLIPTKVFYEGVLEHV